MREFRYSVLLVSLVLLFAAVPFLRESPNQTWIINVLLTAILVTAVLTVTDDGLPKMAVPLLAVASLGLNWFRTFQHGEIVTLALSTNAAFLSVIAALILRDVLSRGRVSFDRICGAVCVYLLLALTSALAFLIVDHVQPGSFNFSADASATYEQEYPLSEFMYFSMTTITTLGYGDYTPISPVAKTLATLEAFIGQIYLVVLVARLVSLHTAAEVAGSDTTTVAGKD